MTDLNQHMRSLKSGGEPFPELARVFAGRYAAEKAGVPCCFYTITRRYVDPEHACPEEMVIGCSRGYIPLRDEMETPGSFRDRLCRKCVEEAASAYGLSIQA